MSIHYTAKSLKVFITPTSRTGTAPPIIVYVKYLLYTHARDAEVWEEYPLVQPGQEGDKFTATLLSGRGEGVLQQGAHSVLNGSGNEALQLPEEEVDQRVVER